MLKRKVPNEKRTFFTDEADETLSELEHDSSKQKIYKAVSKTLGFMETNLRHPSLNTHKYTTLKRAKGRKGL